MCVYIYQRVRYTLYVGLARAVTPTNTNFQPLLLPTQVGMPYTNTHKYRTSYFKFTHTVKLKPIIKAKISGNLVTSGISDVAIASVHYEKPRMKKMIMIIIISTSNRKTIY